MNKAIFWDLQGTLGGNPVSNIKEFQPYPFAKEALSLAKDLGFINIVVTNQSGISKGKLSFEEYEQERDRIISEFNSDGALIDDFLCCPHSRSDNCQCKKPKTGMIDEATEKYNLEILSCFVIGDMGMNEIVMAKNAGCPGILVLTGAGRGSLGEFRDTWRDYEADYIAEDALDAVRIIEERITGKMSDRPQNIFDDPEFFKGYYELRERDDNQNVLVEQPAIKKLIPDVSGKSVLDLGCGYGENCSEFERAGASRVVGVDLSEKMLEVALSENTGDKIEYLKMDMTDVDTIDGSFDLIFSSLAFHYIDDFDGFVKKLYNKLKPGGVLLFSQEHPLNTAGNGSYNRDENGDAVSFNLYDYARPGKRSSNWIVDGVEKYHRTLSGVLNPLADAGFVIEKIVEPTPSDDAIAKRPSLVKLFIKPCFLIVLAKREK